MAVKNSKFHSSTLHSAFVPTSAYYTYQHLSANSIAAYEGWAYTTDFPTTLKLTTHKTPAISIDEIVDLQMQHLRFPTPPITPPYSNAYNTYKIASVPATRRSTNTSHTVEEIRTQSVIMKIGQNQLDCNMPPTPEHIDDMAVDIVGLDDANDSVEPERITMSTTSSASSSPKRSEYTCEWIDCGRDHNTLEALAAHVTKIHAVTSPADGLYYCRWHGCARTRGFSARYKMLVHARTHTKEKPHQCHLCTKSFSRAENLKIHIRSHSGEKPYLCTYEGCHKAYSNSSDRFKHTRTHAMDKPYICKVPGCQKRYTDPSSLRKHVKTFKHATQLIATAAVTPCKNVLIGGANTAEIQQASPPQTQKPIMVPNLAQQAAAINGSNHLHSDAYAAKGYSDASIPVCQFCVAPAPPPHYYLNAMEDDLCSNIKAAQLDYYFTTTGHSPPRSAPTTSNSCSSNIHIDASTGLTIELDTPLDLRMNRR